METFFCGNCGEEVASTAKVCPNCGARFEKEEISSSVIVSREVSFDTKVKKTVLGLEKIADVIKILSIIAAVLVFFGGIIIASEYEEGGGAVFFVYTIYTVVLLCNAYISYAVFNWLSHMLNCVYQLTKKKK